MEKLIHEFVWCPEEKGNCKSPAIFGFVERNV
jgi:hypothetical protein